VNILATPFSGLLWAEFGLLDELVANRSSATGNKYGKFYRIYFSRYCFRPLGLAFGIKDSKHSKPPSNDVLEAEFQRAKKEKKGFLINTSKVNSCS
jgi:hypothetical protein